MINQLLRLGALIATGRFLKPRLKGLLVLAVVWTALWFVHSEYVSYVELSGDRAWVLRASLLKLGLYSLSVGLYVLLVERPLWPRPLKMPPPAAARPDHSPERVTAQSAIVPEPPALPAADDGFDFLRRKPRLKGSIDKLLNK